MEQRLSTGLDAIDRELGGGLPAGTLVLMEVPAGSQYEPLLWAAMAERPTVYLTTVRTESSVRGDLADLEFGPDHQVNGVDVETPIRDASGVVEMVDRQANVVVDLLDPLERTDDRHRYVTFATGLNRHLGATGGVGLLVGTKADRPPSCRGYTQSIADVVLELQSVVSGGRVAHELVVRKYRGGDLPERTIKLRLDREVAVDTSRDIA